MEEDGELEIEDYYFGQWDGIFKSLNSESIEFNINLWGWLVMDESGDLWFFPGDIDSMPEKKDGEWIGNNPIHVECKKKLDASLVICPRYICFKYTSIL